MSRVVREFERGDYAPPERYRVEWFSGVSDEWGFANSQNHLHKAFAEAADDAYRHGIRTRVVDTWPEGEVD